MSKDVDGAMTSTRKREANRQNAQRSTGPTSSAGKRRASQNAFRHGLGALEAIGGVDNPEVRTIVDALCRAHGNSAAMRDQALIIAECQIVIRRVRAAKAALIE